MKTSTDPHAASAATIWPPPAADVVDAAPDYGTMNRELLAEKLYEAFHGFDHSTLTRTPAIRREWLDVVDVAIADLQGTP